MKAMIFAAGLGTRLRPLTDNMPKALVEVGGKTLLQHTIEKVSAYGFNDIVINVHHFADMIRDFVGRHEFPGCRISISDETDLLRETGGGIRHAAQLLDGNGPFLVHNTDIISDIDLNRLRERYITDELACGKDKMLATLAVSTRDTQRYLLFNRERSGVCRLVAWCNISTGEVKSPYPELRHSPSGNFDTGSFIASNGLHKYAFAGIHMISPHVFGLMEGMPEKFSIIDFYLSNAADHAVTCHIADGNTIIDVGKQNSLEKAGIFLKNFINWQ